MYLEINYKVDRILKVVLDRLIIDYYRFIETKLNENIDSLFYY